ncbi:carbonyl reductase [NADPH] 1 [Aplysia californica]|uniref:carbonyl reductase (NADPH) n=1 Tax=Aplysia californica TaxID=6500 RepID=A0ABM0ZUE6_APLCA|nr:carbonyl reductase [NADPH] 1 [Aplysia californica]
MSTKVAVVTGSNKGIGLAIVRALCQKFQGDVVLTARDESRGQEAVKELEKENLHPKFHPLDVSDHESVVKLRDFLQRQYQGLDVLVNNAGIAYQKDAGFSFAEEVEGTCKVNFFAPLDVCTVLSPLLRPHARVVNVSSMASQVCLTRCSESLQNRFTDPALSMDELVALMNSFVQSAKDGTTESLGFPANSYFTSKLGTTVMSMIQQREMDKARGVETDIIVNACCPGFVSTDMTKHKGRLTPDQGAETPVYLALLPPGTTSPRGKFIREKEISPWDPHAHIPLPSVAK